MLESRPGHRMHMNNYNVLSWSEAWPVRTVCSAGPCFRSQSNSNHGLHIIPTMCFSATWQPGHNNLHQEILECVACRHLQLRSERKRTHFKFCSRAQRLRIRCQHSALPRARLRVNQHQGENCQLQLHSKISSCSRAW